MMHLNADGKLLVSMIRAEFDDCETTANAQKAVRALVKRSLTNNQYSALVSLVVSIGIDQFKKSRMLKLLNTVSLNSCIEASKEFQQYIYCVNDHGRVVEDPFLVKQRELEVDLFLTPEIVAGKHAKQKK
jgi:GH24 family phage-related lysozyme (muramidase)